MQRFHFTRDGYRCLDADGSILYQSIKHEDLFQFVERDVKKLYDLLPQYIKECVDIQQIKPRRTKKSSIVYDQMLENILRLHPFLDNDYLDREIAKYFNVCLIARATALETERGQYYVNESEYLSMFRALFPHGYTLDGAPENPDDYQHHHLYAQYRRNLEEPELVPFAELPFSNLQKAMAFIPNYLYWVLDADATPFENLSLHQRLEVYNTCFQPLELRIAAARVEYYLGNEERICFDGEHASSRAVMDAADAEPFRYLNSNQAYQALDRSAGDHLTRCIQQVIKKTSGEEYCAVYDIEDLYILLFLECQFMYVSQVALRRCRHCGLYFIGDKKLNRYCDRSIAENSARTCRDVGTAIVRQQKIEQDPVMQVYMRAYKTHNARIRKGAMTKQSFQDWVIEAKQRMARISEGPESFNDFKEWLKI